MGPNQTYNLLDGKGNHKHHEKTTFRMGENIFKWWDWQGLNFQVYISSSYNSTTKKQKQPNQKWAEDLNRHFSK